MLVARLLIFIALAGLVSCSCFLALVIVSILRFRRRPNQSPAGDLPFVTLLKPLCGLEPNLEENLASFFEQDYPAFEIVFGTRDARDPALNVVRTLQRRYPYIPTRIVYSGEPSKPNAKVCSLIKMCRRAASDYMVISDSDVHVTPEYLADVVRPLLDPEVGMVTCVYRGVPTGGLWSRLEALGMSVEMTAGVVLADMLEGMKFALGPSMSIRRGALEAIGGMEALADYCADDYVLGNEIFRAGYKVVLSHHIIDHVVLGRSLRSSWEHQVRWMKSTRFSRPKGHLGTGLTFATPFGVVGLFAGLLSGHAGLGFALFAAAMLNRVVLALATGWGAVRDQRSLAFCWLYPVRDFLGFGLWCASYFSREIVWRDQAYRLAPGGRMVRVGTPAEAESESTPVTVDDFA